MKKLTPAHRRSLVLQRETLVQLTADHLRQAAGGENGAGTLITQSWLQSCDAPKPIQG